jgi:UDP-N-acetylmuramoylalanine--D-glutamate ligase
VNYKDYFKDRNIAIIGLGPHGEMIADIKFLLKNKARLSLYDIRSEERLKKHILSLSVGGLQKFSFGKIPDDELLMYDLIILSPEISKRSTFLKKALENGIQIEYPDTIFFKLAPPIILVGIIGVSGKSTVAHLIYGMLKRSFLSHDNQGLFLIDSDSTNGALNHLKKIKKDDLVLARIPENMADLYHDIRISPHVVVITSPTSYEILEYQTQNNFIVAHDRIVDSFKNTINFTPRAKILRTRASSVPNDWEIDKKGIHMIENAALALQTSELFKVPRDIAKDIIQNFLGLRGHIEFVKKISNVDYYNDASSNSPLSTLSALKTLSNNKNIVLIFGGAYTGHDYDHLLINLSQYAKALILISGSGSIGIRDKINQMDDIESLHVLNLEQAVIKAKEIASKGDIVLFSPGFDAVGVDVSRKERGERFVKAVRNL